MAIKDIDRTISRLGLTHLSEMLFYVPRKFNDYRNPIENAANLPTEQKAVGTFTLTRKKFFDKKGVECGTRGAGRAFRGDFLLKDNNGRTVMSNVFGNVFPWYEVKVGDKVTIFGEVGRFNGTPQFSSPEIVPKKMIGKLLPIYGAVRSTASAESIHDLVSAALPYIKDATTLLQANTGLDEETIKKVSGFDSIQSLLESMHRPKSPEEFLRAKDAIKRVSIEEIITKANRVKNRTPVKQSVILVDEDAGDHFKKYKLTGDQQRVVKEVLTDLRSMYPMQRLISGDVGSGKSLTFMIPAVEAWKAGKQVVILCPNEGMVKQIMKELTEDFPGTKSLSVVSRAKPKEPIEGSILVGTTALLNFCVKNDIKPDLLIVDEQHKLSRDQREAIKAPHTNVIEATATCIPRTMALVTHGGMDVSYLKEMPVKKTIETFLIESQQDKGESFKEAKKIIEDGGQIAVVYSMVDDDPESELKSVEASFEKWEKAFPGMVVKAHGKMKDDEKIEAIEAMKAGQKKVLIASSVIEVGLTIPELRGMFVVDADRHGAAGLHQLRGRVARNGGHGKMFMVVNGEIGEDTRARLQLLVEETDGFKISERDMELRGFGDLDVTSEEQSGEAGLAFKGDISIKPSDLKSFVGEPPMEVVNEKQIEPVQTEPEKIEDEQPKPKPIKTFRF